MCSKLGSSFSETKSDDDDTFAGFKKRGQKVVFSDDDNDDDNFSTPKSSTSKGMSCKLQNILHIMIFDNIR